MLRDLGLDPDWDDAGFASQGTDRKCGCSDSEEPVEELAIA